MYSKVFEIIQTSDDLHLVREEISMLKGNLFKKNINTEVRKSFAEIVQAEIEENKITPDEYLAGLEKVLSDVEEVKVQIAFEPNIRSLSMIKEWVSRNVSEFVVLDLYYNPSIIGGGAISFKGKYFDGSIRKKINEKLSGLSK